MENRQNNNFDNRAENTVAYPRENVTYGIASTITVTRSVAESSQSLTLTSQFNYFFSEYFKGLLFVALSSVFIFAMPRVLTKQGNVRGILTDIVKRFMDIVGSIAGLVLTLPAWLIVPVLIKLDSNGPVFYSQTRVGVDRRKRGRRVYQNADVDDRRSRDRRRENYHGQLFEVIKFRTMVTDAEKASGPVWATKNDPRITRLGQFLRKTRLDEIPQFINVLRGDMSLVGPRPERPKFVEDLSQQVPGYTGRLAVKPGITGLAQVENGYDDSISSVKRKVAYDLTYIENLSIWFDIKILFKTIKVVFTGKGAH